MSGFMNKLKDAVTGGTSDSTTDNTTGTSSSTYGNTGTNTSSYGNTGNNTSSYGSSGTAPHTQGPHSTDAANKADPRVDSDGDGRAGYEVGSNRGTGTTGTMGSGVGHPGTGVGTNTTSTPIFGSKDNHAGHSERQDLENYENRHGHTSGLSNLEGSAQREGQYHQGTGTTGSSTGTGGGLLSSLTGGGSSAHQSSSGVGYGQSTTGSGSTGYGQNTTGTGLGSSGNTTGPHNSSLLNKLDPRVDSDRDGSRTTGTTGTGAGYSSTSGDAGYPHHHVGLAAAEVITELKEGVSIVNPVHHQHNLYMSDKIEDYQAGSGRHTVGDPNYGLTSGTHGTGSGLTGTTGQGYGNTTTSGPHNSNIANKLDPRVDSDRDGSRTAGQGYGSTGSGLTGSTGQGYDSTGTGSGLTGTTGQGYGNTTTSGPHNSNVLNKADPRVDSDRDGSRLH